MLTMWTEIHQNRAAGYSDVLRIVFNSDGRSSQLSCIMAEAIPSARGKCSRCARDGSCCRRRLKHLRFLPNRSTHIARGDMHPLGLSYYLGPVDDG